MTAPEVETQHDRFNGGCLCGNVRIVAAGRPYRYERDRDATGRSEAI